MPDVSAALDRAVQFVVVGDMDLAQNTLRRHDLIGAHDEQQPVGTEYTISGQQIEQRMFGEERAAERFREVNQIWNHFIFTIRPKGGELEAVARLFALGVVAVQCLLDVALACRIAVILGVGSVRYDEQLYIFEQPAACPETLPLVTVDLVESLPDVDAAAFQFDMHQRQTVYQYGNVVTIGTCTVVHLVLVDDLQ